MASMVSLSKSEILAARFAPYVDELQDFFRSRHVAFGAPSDLLHFNDHLADPYFADEMVSMVRSILYREEAALPRAELMEIVALAVGGPGAEEPADELEAPRRAILAFVTEVVRSQTAEPLPDTPSELTVAALAGLPQVEAGSRSDRFSPESAPARADDLSVPAQVLDTSSFAINDRLSRALLDEEARRALAHAAPNAPAGPTGPSPAALQSSARVAPLRASGSLLALLREAYWIPGVCVLLLALGAAWRLETHLRPASSAALGRRAQLPAALPGVLRPKFSPHATALRHAAAPASKAPESPSRVGAATLLPKPSARWATNPARAPVQPSPEFPPAGESRPGHPPRSSSPRPSVSDLPLDPREGVFLASSGAMAAHLISAPAPGYPKLATFAHVEGEVIVQVVVARNGTVEATRVLQGPRLLRGAAEHAIRRWHYRPYIVDGEPTDVATIVTVNFRLRP